MTFASRLKSLRKSRRLTIEQVASGAGVCKQTMYTWESGSSLPQKENQAAIIRFYGMTTGEFFAPIVRMTFRNQKPRGRAKARWTDKLARKRLGKKIRALRKKAELTLEELGIVCDSTKQCVSLWERGHAGPSRSSRKCLSDFFEIPEKEFHIESVKQEKRKVAHGSKRNLQDAP